MVKIKNQSHINIIIILLMGYPKLSIQNKPKNPINSQKYPLR